MSWYDPFGVHHLARPIAHGVASHFTPHVEVVGPQAGSGANPLAPIGHLLAGLQVNRPAHHRPAPASRPRPIRAPRPSSGTRTPASSGSASQGVSGASAGMSDSGVGGNHRVVRRPLTFTDAHGNVHRVRTSRVSGATSAPAGPKVDPLSKLVDEIIAGQNVGLEGDKKAIIEQSAGNVNQTNRLSDFYDQQVGAIRDDATDDFGRMVARAAELKGISADTIAKNQDYLRSLMGPSNGGTGQQQAATEAAQTQGAVAASADNMIHDLEGEGQSLGTTMAQLQASGRAAQREMNQQEALRASAGIRDLDRAMAENKGKRPEMLYQMQQAQQAAALDQAIAQQKLGVDMAKLQSEDNYRQGQLALGAARLDPQAAGHAADDHADPSIYGNIPKKYQAAVKEAYDHVFTQEKGPDGKPTGNRIPVAQPWRTAWNLLTDRAGLNPTTAALLASKWFPDSINSSDPRHILALLANRGVSTPAQRRIITQYFGPGGWAAAHRRHGVLGAIDFAGQAIDTLPNH